MAGAADNTTITHSLPKYMTQVTYYALSLSTVASTVVGSLRANSCLLLAVYIRQYDITRGPGSTVQHVPYLRHTHCRPIRPTTPMRDRQLTLMHGNA